MVSTDEAKANVEQLLEALANKTGPHAFGPPEVFIINNDNHHAKHVGRTANGNQFFLTTPFEPGGREFVALYIFNHRGSLVDSKISDLGPRTTLDLENREKLVRQYLAELGEVKCVAIGVRPFVVEHLCLAFGLIPKSFIDEEKQIRWHVDMHPGNYMSFWEPWNSGTYDT